MNILQNRIDSFNKGKQPWPHTKDLSTIESVSLFFLLRYASKPIQKNI